MKVRLADIAAAAEVSEATVSRVLNGKSGVRDETRRLVLEVAARLGHSDGPGVQPLVGIVVPDVDNPAFALYADHVEEELRRRGYRALAAMRSRTPDEERAALERLAAAGARGTVVVSGFHANAGHPTTHYRELAAHGSRFVFVNGPRDDLEAPCVSNDDVETMRLSLTHLRELGHRRIGLALGDEDTFPVRAKSRAFDRLAPELLGPAGRTVTAFTIFTAEGGAQAADSLVADGCTAIVCGSDIMALGAIGALISRGLDVPRDVSVVGFDDTPLMRFTSPALTSVRQGVGRIAHAAVASLDSALRSDEPPLHSEVLVKPELIVRSTTAAAPGRR